KGTMPAGQLWEAYKSLLLTNGTMYRQIVLPPAAPQAAVTTLRAAVAQLASDEDYIAEANKVMGEAPEYVTSASLNGDVRNALTISPELKAFMDVYGKSQPK